MKTTRWLIAVLLLLTCACSLSGQAISTPDPGSVDQESPTLTTDIPSNEEPTSEAPINIEPTAEEPAIEETEVTEEPATEEPSRPTPDINNTPTDALTIVALGDSLTQGDGDETGQGGYPPRLQALLQGIRPGAQVINLGKSGWASADLINGLNGEPSQLDQALAAKPQIAILWIGSNDLWYLYEYGPDPMTEEAEQADLEAYEANIETIMGKLSQVHIKIFVALLDDQSKRPVVANPPNPAEPAFSAITADDLARMSRHVDAYNNILRKKAIYYDSVIVDFFNTDIFTNSATLYTDGNHPNVAGYEKITSIWFAAFEGYLK